MALTTGAFWALTRLAARTPARRVAAFSHGRSVPSHYFRRPPVPLGCAVLITLQLLVCLVTACFHSDIRSSTRRMSNRNETASAPSSQQQLKYPQQPQPPKGAKGASGPISYKQKVQQASYLAHNFTFIYHNYAMCCSRCQLDLLTIFGALIIQTAIKE